MKRFLVIQTAFIGDVVLATPVVEKLHLHFPEAEIDFLVRKGNESLLNGHPFLNNVLIWEKSRQKKKNLFKILKKVQKRHYDYVINLQRFSSTGMLTWLSGAREKIGFRKNPFAFSYTLRKQHKIEEGIHEVDRNLSLISHLTDDSRTMPRLYPVPQHFEKTAEYKHEPYICIAPASAWFTKQFPIEKWTGLIGQIPGNFNIYLLGGPDDRLHHSSLTAKLKDKRIIDLAGKLSLLESAAMMKDAAMNYVNDSAPLHIASAMNAPVTAVFCSTVPRFGFGPLSDNGHIVQVEEPLYCRPCGLHGKKACPEGHFRCAFEIDVSQFPKPEGENVNR